MQTFLPYTSFTESVRALDRQRLGKQRVEAWQILQTLTGESTGWAHHPAVLMWRGFERALCAYGITVCDEWIRRGYQDTMRERFAFALQTFIGPTTPPWLGDEDFPPFAPEQPDSQAPGPLRAADPGRPPTICRTCGPNRRTRGRRCKFVQCNTLKRTS